MPDAKKEPLFNKDHFRETQIFLLVLILLGALVARFAFIFSGFAQYLGWWDTFLVWLRYLWGIFKIFAVVIIGACAWWTTYSRMRIHNLEEEDQKIYGKGPEPTSGPVEQKGNEKWRKVIEHLNSPNPANWRLAILEADIMLDEALTAKGYTGDSIGDKLKTVDPSDMLTLQLAWEAHLVRNRIAHSGSDFELNEREAKRVIALFEKVFKEFQII